MRELRGRRALVTGATGGLGRAIVRALAAEGAELVATGRDERQLAGLAEAFGAETIRVDLQEPSAIGQLVDQAGEVDVLVNNAGIIFYPAFTELSEDDLRRAVAVNLTAPMVLTRRLLPGMLARGRGHVVALSSLAGYAYPAYQAAYATTKAGLVALMRSLRAEYHGKPVGFSVVSPIYVEEAGVYADNVKPHGLRSPRLVGTVGPDRVARAVVKAIRRDLPEVVVASRPMRPVFALDALSPRLGEAIVRWVGINRMQAEAAEAHREDERQG